METLPLSLFLKTAWGNVFYQLSSLKRDLRFLIMLFCFADGLGESITLGGLTANPPFTSTGTILLATRRSNQQGPHLLHTSFCHDGHAWPNSSYSLAVLLVGEDPDPLSNFFPLSFTLARKPPSNPYSWKIQQVNGTAAWLSTMEPQQCGTYETWLSVTNHQGLAGPESKVTVQLCGCEVKALLLVAGGIGLSDGAIIAIVLSILAVLLFAMLVFCLPLWLLMPVKKAPPSSFMNIAPGSVFTYSQEAGEEENKILDFPQNEVHGNQVSELQPRAVGMRSDAMTKVEIDGQRAGHGVQGLGAAAGQMDNSLTTSWMRESGEDVVGLDPISMLSQQLLSSQSKNKDHTPQGSGNKVQEHPIEILDSPQNEVHGNQVFELQPRAVRMRSDAMTKVEIDGHRTGHGIQGLGATAEQRDNSLTTSWMQESGEDVVGLDPISMLSQQLSSQSKNKDHTPQGSGNKVQEHPIELQVKTLETCAPDTLLVYNFEGFSSCASSLSAISEI